VASRSATTAMDARATEPDARNETPKLTPTITVSRQPQRLVALERANQVRLARALLKRRIADGAVSAGQVILACPHEASRWSVGELLMSQPQWGSTRSRRFLERNQIGELKPVGELTERQRQMLAGQLSPRVRPIDSHSGSRSGEIGGR
jgi:hypothetical protein